MFQLLHLWHFVKSCPSPHDLYCFYFPSLCCIRICINTCWLHICLNRIDELVALCVCRCALPQHSLLPTKHVNPQWLTRILYSWVTVIYVIFMAGRLAELLLSCCWVLWLEKVSHCHQTPLCTCHCTSSHAYYVVFEMFKSLFLMSSVWYMCSTSS